MSGQHKDWLPFVKTVAVKAGDSILEVYGSQDEIEIEIKSDESPVTKADHAAHLVIAEGLKQLTPDVPVLSEEGGLPSFAERSSWDRYWLVDPLDGTKEFINRNGEFTVNIALIEAGEPVMGVVYVPVKEIMYSAVRGCGAFKAVAGKDEAIEIRKLDKRELRVVASRRHGAEALEGVLNRLEGEFGDIQRVSMGSSLKICMVADGQADWYPRLALTSEWDTAAAHAVLLEAGGTILNNDDLQPLKYNQKDSLLNPFFHAIADIEVDWSTMIKGA